MGSALVAIPLGRRNSEIKMAVDLFSLVLQSTASWAIGKIFDTVLGCGKCGTMAIDPIPVNNISTNNLICSKCYGSLDQYVNATSHTVQKNNAIVGGYISNIHWEKWGGLWQPRFQPLFDIDIVNSKYEDFVVKIQISDYDNYNLIFEDKTILRPRYERSKWTDYWWKISPSNFPKEKIVFAIDIFLLNTWGDELHRIRSLGDWNGGSD